MEPIVFRRWSNKKWAVLASLHKVIIIGTLCFSNQILGQEVVTGRPDSSQTEIMVMLDEVEATGEWPADLEEATLKPLIQITAIDVSHAAATTPEDLLEYVPQVDIRQRGRHGTQADLTIQGGSFDQSMVLLNGINLSDPQTGHFQLNLPVDLHSISRIEVVTGSASRRFGTHAFTGAVNVVTDPIDSTYYNAGFRIGQHRLYRANLKTNFSGKYVSTLIGVNTSGSDGYRENTDFRTSHAFIHSTAGKEKFKTHVMVGLNSRAFGANAFYTPRFIHQYEETTTGLAALKMERNESRSTFTFNAYYRLNRDHFLLDRQNPQFYHNDHLTRVTGADLSGRLSSKAGVSHTGIHYRGENIRSTSLGEAYLPGEEIPFNDTITFTHGHLRNQFNWNLNHTYEWSRLMMTGGFMVHLNSDLDFRPRIFPGLDIRLRLPAEFRIYVSANQSMRLPTFTDLYYQGPSNIGNPHLVPEKATLYEMGCYRQARGFHMGLNAFFRQGRDLIDWIWMEDEKWHTMNLTQVNAWGGDIRLKYHREQPLHTLLGIETGEFSYTFAHLTKITEQVNSRYILDNLRNKVVLGITLSMADMFLLSVKVNGQDRNGTYMAYDLESGLSHEQPYEPFVLMDVRITYSIGRLRLFVETTNLFDATYNDIGNVIQPGRWALAGFEIR